MNRNFVCRCRLIIDSLPGEIRNSTLLFNLLAILLRENKFLLNFREFYALNPDFDLCQLYTPGSIYYSASFSSNTDCNSIHLALILDILEGIKPPSILDVGCGSGYLLKKIKDTIPFAHCVGIDIVCKQSVNIPDKKKNINFNMINSNIINYLPKLEDNSFGISICSHVIEHLREPSSVVQHLRRISTIAFIIVIPLEKRFKWGLNYHVQFYPSSKDFLGFVKPAGKFKIYEILGDLLYIEYLSDSISLQS